MKNVNHSNDKARIVCLILIFSSLTLSCGKAKDINKVEPNYVKKSYFDGEWYNRAVVVDKQYNDVSSFMGSQCNLDRLKFKITKDMLLGYRSYEKAPGSEGANPGEQTAVAAFRIEKHFDIKREYNPVNGLQNNTIIENDFDREWQDREYIRVDLSQNLVPDFRCNDQFRASAMQSLVRNKSNDPKDIWRIRFRNGYFETTSDLIATPQPEACAQTGDFNCAANEIKIKFSFLKVDPNSIYEPKQYEDRRPIKVGTRIIDGKPEACLSGDEGCENIESVWSAITPMGKEKCDPTRHNIENCRQETVPLFAQFGYFRTEIDNFDREHGSTHAGRIQYMNRWNIWQHSENNERVPKPIVYYLNVKFPKDLREMAQNLAKDWNFAFSDGLAKSFDKNGTAQDIESEYGKIFQIKLNDCNEENVKFYTNEHGLAGAMAESGIATVTEGNLEEACAVLEWASRSRGIEPSFDWQRLGDLRYSFLNYTDKAELVGPLGYGPSDADPLTGEIISATANIYGPSLDVYASLGADMVQLLNNQVTKQNVVNRMVSEEEVNNFSTLFDARAGTETLASSPVFSNLSSSDLTRGSITDLRKMGSQVKSEDDKLRPEDDIGQMANEISNLAQYEKKIDYFSQRNACFLAETMEPAMAELAKFLQGKSQEDAYKFIRAKVFYGVALHEVGHTFGLRHNFQASSDAMNFRPQTWGVDTGDARMRAASDRVSELRYSSIMDYHQRINSDFGGIGLYDEAAIKAGYFDLVEVFDESNGIFVPGNLFDRLNAFHYKDLPYLFAGGSAELTVLMRYMMLSRAAKAGDVNAKLDVKTIGIPSHPENLYKRTYISFDEYFKAQSLRTVGQPNRDGGFIYAVPYKYCSDELASGGSLMCNRWDMGASVEEIIDNAAELYDSYYLFNSFRRDRVNFDPIGYRQRLYARTFQPMTTAYKYMYAYRDSDSRFLPIIQDITVAAYKGINFLGKILQTPEPGNYCLSGSMYVKETEVKKCNSPITLNQDQGKYYDNRYSNEFFYKQQNVGHMYDKILAIHALTDDTAILTRDFGVKTVRGAASIGYYRIFAPEMIRLFSSYIRNDVAAHAPEIVVEDGRPIVKYRPIVGLQSNAKAVGPVIKPSESWILRYYATALPMVRFSNTVDKQYSFAKLARIYLAGSKNDRTVSSSTEEAMFTDPISKLKYRAITPIGENNAPGFRLVADAQDFVNDGTNGKPQGRWHLAAQALEQATTDYGVAISMHPGNTALLRPIEQSLLQTKIEKQEADSELSEKIQMVDLIRKLSDALEYGN